METTTPQFPTNFHRHVNGYIQLIMTCSDKRLFYSIGSSVPEKVWETAKKHKEKYLNYLTPDVKAQILEIENLVAEFIKDRKEVKSSELKDFLKNSQGRNEPAAERKKRFFDKVRDKLTEVSNLYAPATIKNLKASLVVLEKFGQDVCLDLSFDSTSDAVRTKFLLWTKDQGMSRAYTDRVIKDWKRFFKLFEKTLNFKRLNDIETKKFHLDESEIAIIEALKLTGVDEEIRDRFLINLETGFRISDMKYLTIQENFDFDNATIKKDTKKTKKEAEVDITERIMRVVEKYNGPWPFNKSTAILPSQYHEVVVNRRIKVIIKAAFEAAAKSDPSFKMPIETLLISRLSVGMRGKMKEKIKSKEWKLGSDPDSILIPKFDLITNHSARRSAITNKLEGGVSEIELQTMFNIKPRTMARYNKLTAERVAKTRGKAMAEKLAKAAELAKERA